MNANPAAESSLKNVTKPASIQWLAEVDTSELTHNVCKLTNAFWQRANSTKQNKYPVFHSTEHIVLRFVDANQDPREFQTHASWHLFASYCLPLMAQVANCLKIQNPIYPKAMFARLKARSIIEQHIDHGSSHKQAHKVHIPLITNEDTTFTIAKESFSLLAGNAYEVNNLTWHGVNNNSDQDRVHFIFEVFDNPTETSNDVSNKKTDRHSS